MKSSKTSINIYLLFIILVLFQNCNNSNSQNYDKNKVIEYEKTQIKTYILKNTSFFQETYSNGIISSEEISEIHFTTQGQIITSLIKEGQYVKKGQLLAQLDISKRQFELEKAKIKFANAQNNLENILIGQGYELKDSVKIPKNILRKAKIKSQWLIEFINLRQAQYNLESSYIKAPFNGIVANINKHKYDYVSNSDILCTIINNSKYNVLFTIFETDRNKISFNQNIEIQTNEGDTIFAKINQINPQVEKGQFNVKAELIQAKQKVIIGMNVKVLIKNKISNKLIVPKSSIITNQNRDVIFTVQKGKAIWNDVTLGDENANYIIIKSGLKQGDTVITEGNINIEHDTEVEIISKNQQ